MAGVPESNEVNEERAIELRSGNPEALAESIGGLPQPSQYDPVEELKARMAEHIESFDLLYPHFPARARAFLKAYCVVPIISRAAQHAKIDRSTVGCWLGKHKGKENMTLEGFKEAFDLAEQAGREFIESEAYEKAIVGTYEPIVSGGRVVGVKLVKDSNLHKTILQGMYSGKYGKRNDINLNAGAGGTIQVVLDKATEEQL